MPTSFANSFTSNYGRLGDESRSFEEEQRQRLQLGPRLLGSIGYAPAEQQAMRVATAAPIAGSFRNASEELGNYAARTGSNAGVASGQIKLAQERGLALSPALAGLEGKFADARRDDDRYNTGLTQQDYQQTAGNVQGAQSMRNSMLGTEAGLVGQQMGDASAMERLKLSEAGAKERLGMQLDASKPGVGDYVRGAIGGAIESIAPTLATAGLKKIPGVGGLLGGGAGAAAAQTAQVAALPGIAGAAGAAGLGTAAGAGVGAAGVAPAFSSLAAGAAELGGVAGVAGSAGLGGAAAAGGSAAATGASTAAATQGAALTAGGSTGFGATLGALATNPVTWAVAGALAGTAIWMKSQAHHEANTWVNGFQNPFDQNMNTISQEFANAAESGQLRRGDAQQAQAEAQRLAQEYLTKLEQFGQQGDDERTVADQARATFDRYYPPLFQYYNDIIESLPA